MRVGQRHPIGTTIGCLPDAAARRAGVNRIRVTGIERDGFDVLSESLLLLLGELRFVVEVQLDEQRRLPVEDTELVLDHLRTQGWHLQLPPKETLAVANHPAYHHNVRDDRDE